MSARFVFRSGWVLMMALGFGIVRGSTMPQITDQPESITVGPGDTAGFSVSAGPGPVSYQWYFKGAALPNADGAYILIPNVQSSQAGDYAVKVTNGAGTVTSDAAHLAIAGDNTQWVDPTFRGLAKQALTVFTLPDGSYLVPYGWSNTVGIVHVLVDGTIDYTTPALTPADLGPNEIVSCTACALQADGKLLVLMSGRGTGHDPAAPAYTVNVLLRLNVDGSRDASFTPAKASSLNPSVLIATGEKILIALSGQMVRLNADGSVDSTFNAEPAYAANGAIAVEQAAVDPSGRIVVAGGGILWRLQGNGKGDGTFPVVGIQGPATKVVVATDGAIYVGSTTTPTGATTTTFHLMRVLASGALDAAFQPLACPVNQTGYTPDFAVQPDGRVLLAGAITLPVPKDGSVPNPALRALARLMADGSLDSHFSPPYPTSSDGTVLGTANWYPQADGTHAMLVTPEGVTRYNLSSLTAVDPPKILESLPASASVLAGDDLAMQVVAVGAGPLKIGGQGARSTVLQGNTLTFHDVQAVPTITVAGPGGVTAQSAQVSFVPSAPRFVPVLASLTARPGQDATFRTEVRGSEPITLQWLEDGNILTESLLTTAPTTLTIQSASASDVGTYTLRASNRVGSSQSQATLTIGASSELSNLSVRGLAGAGDNVIIVGMIVDTDKAGLFQAVGPELSRYAVSGVLADPIATCHLADGRLITNDDVNFSPDSTGDFYRRLNVTPLTIGQSRSSEIITILPAGANTIVVGGVGGTTGVVLAQMFDAENSANHIRNLSARVYASTGDATAIVGFIVRGNAPKKVLLRCVGPGLAAQHVSNFLPDPNLTLVDMSSRATIAANDDWGTGANLAEVRSAAQTVGAFALAEGSKDAALLITLAPGSYTALVGGTDRAGGVVLLEVYDVP